MMIQTILTIKISSIIVIERAILIYNKSSFINTPKTSSSSSNFIIGDKFDFILFEELRLLGFPLLLLRELLLLLQLIFLSNSSSSKLISIKLSILSSLDKLFILDPPSDFLHALLKLLLFIKLLFSLYLYFLISV